MENLSSFASGRENDTFGPIISTYLDLVGERKFCNAGGLSVMTLNQIKNKEWSWVSLQLDSKRSLEE